MSLLVKMLNAELAAVKAEVAALRADREALREAAERVLVRYRPRIYEFEGNGPHSELHDLQRILAALAVPSVDATAEAKPCECGWPKSDCAEGVESVLECPRFASQGPR